MNPSFQFSSRCRRTGRQPIGYLMSQAVNNPGLVSLAAGLVDYATLPAADVLELTEQLLSGARGALPLQYGATQGLSELRALLLDHVAQLDHVRPECIGVDADSVVVTTGSQQLLFLLTDVLVDPGDIVLTAWPSYFVYTGALQAMGAEVRCVDMDAEGMIPEALEARLAEIDGAGKLERVKVVYVVDYHQNPTGFTLSRARKPAILDIVKRYSRRHRILLLEDAAYRELTYEGDAAPSIKSYDVENRYVALAQSFSKTFSPGLKVGFGVLPRDLVEPVLLQKGGHDFGSTNFSQHIIHAALASGLYARHVQGLRSSYAQKRDTMLAALDDELAGFTAAGVRWTRPRGGLYVWLTLPESCDSSFGQPLFERALEKGVIYVPGECCYPEDPTRSAPRNEMRLSFGAVSAADVREGVRRLAAALRETLDPVSPGALRRARTG